MKKSILSLAGIAAGLAILAGSLSGTSGSSGTAFAADVPTATPTQNVPAPRTTAKFTFSCTKYLYQLQVGEIATCTFRIDNPPAAPGPITGVTFQHFAGGFTVLDAPEAGPVTIGVNEVYTSTATYRNDGQARPSGPSRVNWFVNGVYKGSVTEDRPRP